jgi:hypothetical protein
MQLVTQVLTKLQDDLTVILSTVVFFDRALLNFLSSVIYFHRIMVISLKVRHVTVLAWLLALVCSSWLAPTS